MGRIVCRICRVKVTFKISRFSFSCITCTLKCFIIFLYLVLYLSADAGSADSILGGAGVGRRECRRVSFVVPEPGAAVAMEAVLGRQGCAHVPGRPADQGDTGAAPTGRDYSYL